MNERLILWAIVIGYMLFVFTKGVLKSRKIGDTDDYLVAGRNVRWFFLFATMGATVIGGGYSIGAIGKTYEWGVLMLLVSTGGYFHFIFSGLVVAPQFREAELYTVAGYFGLRFGERSRFLMLILSLLFSVFIVAAQMAAFGTVLAAILPGVADATHLLRWAILISGLMVVIYSTAGGLLAVIHTDVYQFIVLLAGFVITLAFCVPDIVGSYNPDTGKFVPTRFGSIDLESPRSLAAEITEGEDPLDAFVRTHFTAEDLIELQAPDSGAQFSYVRQRVLVEGLNRLLDDTTFAAQPFIANIQLRSQTRDLLEADPEGRDLRRLNLSLLQDAYRAEFTKNRTIPDYFFKLEGGKGWLFLITTFLAFLLGETFAPGYATRYCVGKDVKETKKGIAGVGFFLALTFPVILFFIALYARIHFPDIDPQQALPMVVQQLGSPIIGGLMIGALLMAVMSSADSALNSATAIFVKDLFEHQLGWKDKGDGRMLRLARICTAALGLSAILIAVLWSDIIGLLLFTYHVWAPAVILPVTVGAIWKLRSAKLSQNIFVTMLAATVITMLFRLFMYLHGRLEWSILEGKLLDVATQVDPAVFGVVVSCIVFLLLSLITRYDDAETGPRSA
jgi:Na+/proline symporter